MQQIWSFPDLSGNSGSLCGCESSIRIFRLKGDARNVHKGAQDIKTYRFDKKREKNEKRLKSCDFFYFVEFVECFYGSETVDIQVFYFVSYPAQDGVFQLEER